MSVSNQNIEITQIVLPNELRWNPFFNEGLGDIWEKIFVYLTPQETCQSRLICKRIDSIVLEHPVFGNYPETFAITYKLFHRFFSSPGLENYFERMIEEQKNLLRQADQLPVSTTQELTDIDNIKAQTLALMKEEKIDEAVGQIEALEDKEDQFGVFLSGVPFLKNHEQFFKIADCMEITSQQYLFAKEFYKNSSYAALTSWEELVNNTNYNNFWSYIGARAGLGIRCIQANQFENADQIFNALIQKFTVGIQDANYRQLMIPLIQDENIDEEVPRGQNEDKSFMVSVFYEAGLLWKAAEFLQGVRLAENLEKESVSFFFSHIQQPSLFSRLLNVFTDHSAAIEMRKFIAHYKTPIDEFLKPQILESQNQRKRKLEQVEQGVDTQED